MRAGGLGVVMQWLILNKHSSTDYVEVEIVENMCKANFMILRGSKLCCYFALIELLHEKKA